MSNRSMEPLKRHPNEEALSAYRDRELTPSERAAVDAHLAQCQSCRLILREYDRFAMDLREETLEVPARLDWELRARLQGSRKGSRLGFLPAAGSLAAAALLLVFATSIFNGLNSTSGASAFPAPNATSVSLTTAMEIAYPAGVDKQAVESSVAIEPPVKVAKEWRGDTLVLKPQEPLQPNTTYSVRAPAAKTQNALPQLPALPLNQPAPAQSPTPAVVTSFTTAPVTVASAPIVVPSPAPAPASTTAGPAVAALATRSGIAVATPESRPSLAAAASQTPAPIASAAIAATADKGPIADLATFLEGPESAGLALGVASGPARGVKIATQPFQGGTMMWRDDENLIYVLRADGTWTAFGETAPEPETTRAATPALAPLVPDLGGTATLKPTATPTPAGLASPGPRPTPALPEEESLAPKGRFGKIWREREEVRSKLGRPTAGEQSANGAARSFANAVVVVSERRSAYVLFSDGRWQEFAFVAPGAAATRAKLTPTPTPAGPTPPPATGTRVAASTPTPAPTPSGTWVDLRTPEAGCGAPVVRGFALFYAQPLIKARLGCAAAPEKSVALAEQAFEGGRLLWRADTKTIYTLTSDGRWRPNQDTYAEGEALAPESAPPGLLAPTRGFGKAWREDAETRGYLGWATAVERGYSGAVQEFAGGILLWSDTKDILVLFDDGRWEKHPDLFSE